MSPYKYIPIAAKLRALITSGQLLPGHPLPSEDRLASTHEASVSVIRRALADLRSEGLITTVKGGASYVRDRRPVQLAVSRYSRTFHAGLPAPFQAAAHASGLIGSVRVVHVGRLAADTPTASQLQIPEHTEVIIRVRHMILGELDSETVQESTSIIPAALVEGTPLAEPNRIPTGVYAAFADIGHVPTTLTEKVSARMPTDTEAQTLHLAPGQPVLVVERVTHDQNSQPIELVRLVATADRTTLVYDDLPITPSPPR